MVGSVYIYEFSELVLFPSWAFTNSGGVNISDTDQLTQITSRKETIFEEDWKIG